MLSFGEELCDTCVLLLGTGFLLSAREEVVFGVVGLVCAGGW